MIPTEGDTLTTEGVGVGVGAEGEEGLGVGLDETDGRLEEKELRDELEERLEERPGIFDST
jgi:hypothetical protein